jgi:hypothetical protein
LHRGLWQLPSAVSGDLAQLSRVNKLDKVNVQSDRIVQILDGDPSGCAFSYHDKCRKAGQALLLDDDRVVRCQSTPETARCFLRSPFADLCAELALAGEEEDDGDPKYRDLRGGYAREINKWRGQGGPGRWTGAIVAARNLPGENMSVT